MDGSSLGSVSNPSISSSGDPHKKTWGLRSCEEFKIRDLDSLQSEEGTGTSSLKCSKEHQNEKASKIEQATSFMPSDGQKQAIRDESSPSLDHDAACLSRSSAGNIQSSVNMECDTAALNNRDILRLGLSPVVEKDIGPPIAISKGPDVDLNVTDFSSTVDHNPFYPYKMLGQKKPADASECGSTTGPLEESEPLRVWNKMKQNGFLSSSHGGIPLPKQCARQSKKRKESEEKVIRIKKKNEAPKREQAGSRFTKQAAPSGLLSGLDPGIIKHVRNSKQVHSIIEAMVKSEKHDAQIQNKFSSQLGKGGGWEVNDRRKDQVYNVANQVNLSLDRPYVLSSCEQGSINEANNSEKRLRRDASNASQFTSECDNDTLELKLSSAVTIGSDNASSASGDDISPNQGTSTSLSLKAATVASQWLELLRLDIKGRLAALRRSKKRVRNVIQTELPYLLSTELPSNLENEPCSEHSSGVGCSVSNMHAARWRSLFSQMDKSLYEEAKHLENWLRQVQDMQLHCEKGLKHIGANGLSQLGSSDRRVSKKPDEMECAVMAAAASIYSTCNLIMTKENVPCF